MHDRDGGCGSRSAGWCSRRRDAHGGWRTGHRHPAISRRAGSKPSISAATSSCRVHRRPRARLGRGRHVRRPRRGRGYRATAAEIRSDGVLSDHGCVQSRSASRGAASSVGACVACRDLPLPACCPRIWRAISSTPSTGAPSRRHACGMPPAPGGRSRHASARRRPIDFEGADILAEIDLAGADVGIVTLAPELEAHSIWFAILFPTAGAYRWGIQARRWSRRARQSPPALDTRRISSTACPRSIIVSQG